MDSTIIDNVTKEEVPNSPTFESIDDFLADLKESSYGIHNYEPYDLLF